MKRRMERQRPGRPLRLGLAVAAALAGSAASLPAFAQAPQAPVQAAEMDFRIPPQPLTSALVLFRQQSSASVSVDDGLTRNLVTPGVQGRMTAAAALQRLLAGTGLGYRVAGSGFALQKVAAPTVDAVRLAPVRVIGQRPVPPGGDPYADPEAPYKADRLSSSKFTEPVLDTPRSVMVLTQEALADKDATTLREVARSTAGVTLGSGEGGNAFGDRFFIRGFDARNDVFVDGVRDPGVSIRETFNAEQVEILRGPASSFAGRGTTGGALNIVTKEAQDANFAKVNGTFGFSDSMKRATFDVNRVLAPTLDVRVNGMAQHADVAGRDYATDNRWGIAGAATWRPSDKVTVKAGYSHTSLWGLPDFGVPYNQVERQPVTESDVSRHMYYGIVNRDFTKSKQDVGTLDAQWKVNDWLTFENKLRASHSLLDYVGTIPENPSASNAATAPYSSTPTFFSGYVQLNAQSRYEPVNVLVDQPQATFRFDTGPLQHTAIAGAEFSNERVAIQGYTGLTSELTIGTVYASNGAPIVSVYDPTHYQASPATPMLNGNPLKYRVRTNAGYLMDTASYHDVLIVNGGIRYDDYRISSANNTASVSTDAGITSYNVGVVYKPAKNGSIYAAYATAAEPVGDELDATSSSYGGLAATQNPAQIFGPQKSRSAELGTKWELLDRHLLATAALFQTDVRNARESAPAGLPGYTSGQIVAGAAYRVRGVDLELAGKLTQRWSVMGGLVLMNPKVTKSIVPTNVGLDLANIAKQSFNLLSKYQVNDWLELGGQGVYWSKIKGGSLLAANGNVPYPGQPMPTLLPSHWRFDAFVKARINDRLSVKFSVLNLFDKTYYDAFYQSAQPFIQVAPGRAAYLEASLKF